MKQMRSVACEALLLPLVHEEINVPINENSTLKRHNYKQMTCSESNFDHDVEKFTGALYEEGLNVNTFGCVLIA